MCGIFGYSGPRQAVPILLEGLHALEYRGYDSAGLAVFDPQAEIKICKCAGRVGELAAIAGAAPTESVCGIAHTRWATHGGATARNAHPHRCGRVCAVHNGIIENEAALRGELAYPWLSQTDTEVAVALIDSLYDGDPAAALAAAGSRLKGSFALALLFADRPGEIWAVRRGSPLIVGIADGECFLSSDVAAILRYTRRYQLPEEGETVRLCGGECRIFDAQGRAVQRSPLTADSRFTEPLKRGYDHFMLKEIFETPQALRNTLQTCFSDAVNAVVGRLCGAPALCFTACGTALHAAMAAKPLFEGLAGLPVRTEIASEMSLQLPPLLAGEPVIAVSQSGETADTIAALRLARRNGAAVFSVVNTPDTTLCREADACVLTGAGLEVAVASTKAYSVQAAALSALALRTAFGRHRLDTAEYEALCAALRTLPEQVERVLARRAELREAAAVFEGAQHAFFIGRGLGYAIAAEGSLKLKEISYLHSEAYPAGELKHGTISLIETGTPVVAVSVQPALQPRMLSAVREVTARGARVLALTDAGGAAALSPICERVIVVENVEPSGLLAAVPAVAALQLLAYETACSRGCDVDKPRNLAKSVTVE